MSVTVFCVQLKLARHKGFDLGAAISRRVCRVHAARSQRMLHREKVHILKPPLGARDEAARCHALAQLLDPVDVTIGDAVGRKHVRAVRAQQVPNRARRHAGRRERAKRQVAP